MKPSEIQAAAGHWDEWFAGARAPTGHFWSDHETVQRAINTKVSGDPKVKWFEHTLRSHFHGRLPLPSVLSLACGEGLLERRLAGLGAFERCHACDVSPGAIGTASRRAADAGYGTISYEVADLNTVRLPTAEYDAVWVCMGLHHVEALEHLFEQIAHTLKPGGLLAFNEYVGPNRFQFSTRQKALIRAGLDLIPIRYRRIPAGLPAPELRHQVQEKGVGWLAARVADKIADRDLLGALRRRWSRWRCGKAGTEAYRTSIEFPSVRDVIASDPSESIRSADILTVLSDRFHIVERRDYGATILQFLLGEIIVNFSDDPADVEVLKTLIDYEDTLIARGELTSDFTFVVASPKPK